MTDAVPASPARARVLVVEDDDALAELIATVLEPMAEVRRVRDGIAGLDALRSAVEVGRPFDAVCLDVLMPGMDGLRVLRALRRHEATLPPGQRPGTRVLIMTTQSSRDAVLKAAAEGVDGFLLKPFTPEELVRRLGLGAGAAA